MKFLRENINDFDWIDEKVPTKLNLKPGMKFTHIDKETGKPKEGVTVTITQVHTHDVVSDFHINGERVMDRHRMSKDSIHDLIEKGYWVLIGDIVTESNDFEWTKSAKPFELGEFEEDDISYDDDEAKVYLGEDGKVTYNLDDEEFRDYAYDGYDDWVFDTLISYNGDYDGYYDDDYMDDDEINYLGSYLTDEQKSRLQKLVDYHDKKIEIKPRDVEDWMDDSFSELESVMDELYTGRHDWDDFTSEALTSLGRAINSNRWIVIGETYRNILDESGVDVVSGNGYRYDGVVVTMPFPFKGNKNLSEALLDIGLNEHSWSEEFYEDWDPSGSEDDIRYTFNQMLDVIEEKIKDDEE